MYWFGFTDQPEYAVLPKVDAEVLVAEFKDQLRVNFGQSPSNPEGPARLVTALRDGAETTLLQAVWGISAIRSGHHLRAMPFDGWGSIRDSLLTAAQWAPEVVLGPLAWFVTILDRDSDDGLDRVVFHQDVAERLFGTERLLDIYAGSDLCAFRSAQTRHVYACVKLAATDEGTRKGQPYIIR